MQNTTTPTPLYTLNDFDQIITDGEIEYAIPGVKDRIEEDKPRAKLIKYGPDVLKSSELLAVILGVGTKKEELLSMTNRILREYGEKSLASQTDVKRVMEELDIPEVKACQIVAAFALGRRYYASGKGRAITIRTPKQAAAHLKDMGPLPKEHLRGLYLNSHYQLIQDEVISIGTVTANIVHPREVFRPAIEYSASALILAHNHPSGSLKPSADDVSITKQLKAAGELLGIELLDHIIITEKGFKSISID